MIHSRPGYRGVLYAAETGYSIGKRGVGRTLALWLGVICWAASMWTLALWPLTPSLLFVMGIVFFFVAIVGGDRSADGRP